MSIQIKKQVSLVGTYRGKYKPKETNVKKLQIFLNKQSNESSN